jgi:hypothetical protein
MADLTEWDIEDNTFWENTGQCHSTTFDDRELALKKKALP